MSDINASIQPENGAQQGTEAPAALSAEVGTPVSGESMSPDSRSSSPVSQSVDTPTIVISAMADGGTTAAATETSASASGAQGGDLPNVDTGMSASDGYVPVDASSLSPSTASVATADASGTAAIGAVDGNAQAQYVAAMTPAYASLGAQAASLDQGASHAAHGFADQIAEHVASLEGSADSLLVKIAAEVKKLVAQIKSVL